MIKIDVTYDIIIRVTDVKKMQGCMSGVYVFLSNDNRPLYVGIATNLKLRLVQHLRKETNTKRFVHLFEKVALIHEEDPLLRRMAEIYLINTLNTPVNKNGVHPEGLQARSVSALDIKQKFGRCNGLTNDRKQCRRTAHTNGYCYLHGGNGESLTKLRQDALLEIDKDLIS
ncbi:GIY-YIG nuclease family protein [Domibacillus sp. A3M-37]|uniref:GIY-YIG nuclease family protein n=1 Tax=Domibacillus sp. A3M-37 TaxID=2962037 RepID=UPI0020B6C791|nr:GIY-YIG nuclease family protein [Domibacillus sp. A3M-37]MCP3764730.1 GIY-YIG nuclease family protein [Domibacillus sp. A3M-37]